MSTMAAASATIVGLIALGCVVCGVLGVLDAVRPATVGPRPHDRRAPGACLEGMRHQPVAVTTLVDDRRIGYVCAHCFVRLSALLPPSAALVPTTPGERLEVDDRGYVTNPGVAHWTPRDDDGRPLSELPNPRVGRRR